MGEGPGNCRRNICLHFGIDPRAINRHSYGDTPFFLLLPPGLTWPKKCLLLFYEARFLHDHGGAVFQLTG